MTEFSPEDDFDLEERNALRRVAGLSTELADISEVEYRQLRLERVVLVGVWTTGTLVEAENSLRELARLAETAGSNVLEGLIQRRDRPDPASVSSEATLSLRRIRAQSRFRGGIRRRPRRPDRENQYFRTYTLGERAAYRGWELRRGCRHAVTKHRRAPQLTNSESRSEKPLRRCWNRRLASLARTVTPILSIHLESSIDLRAGDNRTGVG